MKICDKIVCVDDKFGGVGLTINKSYIIKEITKYKDGDISISVINDGGFIDKYWSWRFVDFLKNERKEKLNNLNEID